MDYNTIDQLVEDYLKFRNYHETCNMLQKERKIQSDRNKMSVSGYGGGNGSGGGGGVGSNSNSTIEDINEKILKALEKSDTLRLLTLWDTYVTQTLDPYNSNLVTNARITEFYLHLYCATNPFRDEVLKNVKSPSEAAKYAARSMTIFKHFLETRGRRLLKTPEFQQFKNFHKVAFPPTHPSFSHMFRSTWQENTKLKIVAFLSSYLQPVPPQLIILFNETEQHIHTTIMKKEKEIKAVFRDREQKLMDFSRSIYAISNDLLNAIDEGGTIDKEFLYNFRLKFDEFHEVLGGGAGAGAGGAGGAGQAAAGGGVGAGGAGGGVNDAMNLRGKRRKRTKNKKGNYEPHYNELDYTVINLELSSMVSEVEHELTTYKRPGKRLGSIDIEIVMQSAMQGSALYMALLVYMIRDVDETQPAGVANGELNQQQSEGNYGIKQTRRYAAKKFLEYDIFGLKNPSTNSSQTDEISSNSISPRSGYMITFLHAYAMNIEELCSHSYNPKIHHQSTQKSQSTSSSSEMFAPNNGNITNEEIIENHYGELFEASSAICHSMLLTFTVMINTLSTRELSDYLLKYHLSESFSKVYLTLCEIFLSFPTKIEIFLSHEILNSIQKILYCVLVILGNERKHKLTFIKTGCLDYFMTLLTTVTNEISSQSTSMMILFPLNYNQDNTSSGNGNGNGGDVSGGGGDGDGGAIQSSHHHHHHLLSKYLLYNLLLLNILESSEAYRAMLSTSKSSDNCVVIFNFFSLLLTQFISEYQQLKLTQLEETHSINKQLLLLFRVTLRGLYHLLNEKMSQEMLKQNNEEKLRLLSHLLSSVEVQNILNCLPSTLVHEMRLLLSNLIYQLHVVLVLETVTSDGANNTESSEDKNSIFITELNELKCVLEMGIPLDELFYFYLKELPEEHHMKEYKTMKPKDTGMQLLMNYTKSYIEEHGSLYEGTGGTD